jgi:predicted DNA-binding transcriptional regulator AlpA
MEHPVEPLLRRAQVARILQKPASWLRYAERHRLIPFHKIGQQIRYRRSDVEAWIERQRVVAASQEKSP